MVEREDVPPDVVEVQALGRELHEDGRRLAQEAERARHDEDGDEQAGDRVGPLVARRGDHDGGHDDPDGAQRVVDHLEERGPQVEVRAPPGREDRDGDEVPHETDDPEHEQLGGGHLGRLEQAPDALDGGVRADGQEQRRLREGREHLDTAEAPRAVLGRRAQRERRRDQRDGQPDRVGEHVRRVRQERQAPREHRADGLGREDRRGDAERDGEPPAVVGRVEATCAVVVTRSHRSSIHRCVPMISMNADVF
ncbi:Uncharacterised protein [Mycobacteroides abscessus]|nr:Uncharacterised protein [Mycobacteroides abscessus]